MLKEFKKFIMKGNVINLAVGVVMGSAFTAIVNALVDHIIGPIIAAVSGGEDITHVTISIGSAELGIGEFGQAIIDFLMIAIILFFIVKAVNKLTEPFQEKNDKTPSQPTAEELLADIKDILQRKSSSKASLDIPSEKDDTSAFT